jgi:hypothetical protein
MRTSFHHQSEAQPPNGTLTAATSPDTPSLVRPAQIADRVRRTLGAKGRGSTVRDENYRRSRDFEILFPAAFLKLPRRISIIWVGIAYEVTELWPNKNPEPDAWGFCLLGGALYQVKAVVLGRQQRPIFTGHAALDQLAIIHQRLYGRLSVR